MKKMEMVKAAGIDVQDWVELKEQGYEFVMCDYGYEMACDWEQVLEQLVEKVVKGGMEIDFDEDDDVDHDEKIVYFSLV